MIEKDIIGIVGGMGSYATAYFFRKIIDSFPAEKEWERPRIIIDNNCVMPSRVRAILYNENVDELVDELSKSVDGLVSLGCNKIILACITSHYFLNSLNITYPHLFTSIDLLKGTVDAIKEKEVYICCTEGTAQTRLWDSYFQKDTQIIYPDEHELRKLRIFIEAVKKNNINTEIIESFAEFISKAPCKSIILGCTELPVLYDLIKSQDNKLNKIVYDPLQCGIEILKESLEK